VRTYQIQAKDIGVAESNPQEILLSTESTNRLSLVIPAQEVNPYIPQTTENTREEGYTHKPESEAESKSAAE